MITSDENVFFLQTHENLHWSVIRSTGYSWTRSSPSSE